MYNFSFAVAVHILSLFGIAGGGGSSGGGGGSSGGYSGGGGSSVGGSGSSGSTSFSWVTLVIMVVIFGGVIVFSVYRSRRVIAARRQRMINQLSVAAQSDRIWSEPQLIEYANTVFMNHQRDWSAFSLDSLKLYMTPRYFEHTSLMLAALQLMQRQNQVNDIVIQSTEVAYFNDNADNSLDRFHALIVAKVKDIIIDTETNEIVHSQPLTATQTYKFVRSNDIWLFEGIDQSTDVASSHSLSMMLFADKNQLFYSPDWGWLLLPRRGQLFHKGTFGVSDINNHVIGLYNTMLIQMYTYSATPGSISYIIAQTTVLKRYGNIVVRRRDTGMKGSTKGLNKISTEWADFNKKYDVFASDEEQATSFELLHPAFMEVLESLPFEVSIEVVDNVVYLYTTYVTGVVADNDLRYATLLDVLKRAFKEMRL